MLGDVPNVASRAQSVAESDSVLIIAAVHELVSGLFLVEDRGPQQLKGIPHPVQLYRAIQPTVERRRTQRPAARTQTTFVGRDDDIQLLLSRWEGAREGHGQLVFVMGSQESGNRAWSANSVHASLTIHTYGSSALATNCFRAHLFTRSPRYSTKAWAGAATKALKSVSLCLSAGWNAQG